MQRELELAGRQIVIHESDDPRAARLLIDGTEIPLRYHDGFKGWGVAHTVFGFYPDLERLAEHLIVSNPALVIGHGHGGHADHGGGNHGNGDHSGDDT